MRFRLIKPVSDAYSTREVGYEGDFEYPNIYYENTGKLGICGGHGIYAWAEKDDYVILK